MRLKERGDSRRRRDRLERMTGTNAAWAAWERSSIVTRMLLCLVMGSAFLLFVVTRTCVTETLWIAGVSAALTLFVSMAVQDYDTSNHAARFRAHHDGVGIAAALQQPHTMKMHSNWLSWFLDQFWWASGKFKLQRLIRKSLDKALHKSVVTTLLGKLAVSKVDMGNEFSIDAHHVDVVGHTNNDTMLQIALEVHIGRLSIWFASDVSSSTDDAHGATKLRQNVVNDIDKEHVSEKDETRDKHVKTTKSSASSHGRPHAKSKWKASNSSTRGEGDTEVTIQGMRVVCTLLIRIDAAHRLLMYSFARDGSFKVKVKHFITENVLLSATLTTVKSQIITMIKSGFKKALLEPRRKIFHLNKEWKQFAKMGADVDGRFELKATHFRFLRRITERVESRGRRDGGGSLVIVGTDGDDTTPTSAHKKETRRVRSADRCSNSVSVDASTRSKPTQKFAMSPTSAHKKETRRVRSADRHTSGSSGSGSGSGSGSSDVDVSTPTSTRSKPTHKTVTKRRDSLRKPRKTANNKQDDFLSTSSDDDDDDDEDDEDDDEDDDENTTPGKEGKATRNPNTYEKASPHARYGVVRFDAGASLTVRVKELKGDILQQARAPFLLQTHNDDTKGKTEESASDAHEYHFAPPAASETVVFEGRTIPRGCYTKIIVRASSGSGGATSFIESASGLSYSSEEFSTQIYSQQIDMHGNFIVMYDSFEHVSPRIELCKAGGVFACGDVAVENKRGLVVGAMSIRFGIRHSGHGGNAMLQALRDEAALYARARTEEEAEVAVARRKLELASLDDAAGLVKNKIYGWRVTLLYGVNMVASDNNGVSDPYCVLTYNGRQQTTKTQKCTVHPIWNESFYFPVDAPYLGHNFKQHNSFLTIQVFDYDALSSHDFLGQCSVCLDAGMDAIEGLRDGRVHKLQTLLRGVSTGTLVFEVEYMLVDDFNQTESQRQRRSQRTVTMDTSPVDGIDVSQRMSFPRTLPGSTAAVHPVRGLETSDSIHLYDANPDWILSVQIVRIRGAWKSASTSFGMGILRAWLYCQVKLENTVFKSRFLRIARGTNEPSSLAEDHGTGLDFVAGDAVRDDDTTAEVADAHFALRHNPFEACFLNTKASGTESIRHHFLSSILNIKVKSKVAMASLPLMKQYVGSTAISLDTIVDEYEQWRTKAPDAMRNSRLRKLKATEDDVDGSGTVYEIHYELPFRGVNVSNASVTLKMRIQKRSEDRRRKISVTVNSV